MFKTLISQKMSSWYFFLTAELFPRKGSIFTIIFLTKTVKKGYQDNGKCEKSDQKWVNFLNCHKCIAHPKIHNLNKPIILNGFGQLLAGFLFCFVFENMLFLSLASPTPSFPYTKNEIFISECPWWSEHIYFGDKLRWHKIQNWQSQRTKLEVDQLYIKLNHLNSKSDHRKLWTITQEICLLGHVHVSYKSKHVIYLR